MDFDLFCAGCSEDDEEFVIPNSEFRIDALSPCFMEETVVFLWIIAITFNLVWGIRRKPYNRFYIVKLRKLKQEIKIKR